MKEKRKQGILIALEGIDGAGKTTQAKLLVRWLKRNGFTAIYTSEPTNSDVGRLIKQHLSGRRKYPEEAVALLFAADRLYHVERTIKPALSAGRIVVTDRYVHSSIAYQTVSTRMRRWVMQINSLAPKPDLSILIDIPVEKAMERMQKRRRYIYERKEFLEQVRKEYLLLVKRRQMIKVDGTADKLTVNKAVIGHVLKLLNRQTEDKP